MASIVTAIHIYPIKSCGAVSLDRVEVAATGLRGDRLFQLVDGDGNPITQRQIPELATVRPTLTADGLVVSAPDRPNIRVSTPTANDTTVNSLLGASVAAADAGDEAAAWFSDVVGSPVRLVAMTDDTDHRMPLPGVEMGLAWSDAAAALVTNTASLAWLNERADEPFGMDRFRPNITVDAGDAWVEDTWRDVSIGGAKLGLGFAWPRCAIAQVDQDDGSRHPEPAKVLKAYRWCSQAPTVDERMRPLFEGNALFGIGCSIEPVDAVIKVGDPVTVHRRGDRIIAAPM